MAELQVEKLRKEFPTRGEPLVVLRGVDLRLEGGENVAVLGPSGSGKSTLLHLIGALDTPTSGTVRLDGQDPFALPEPELAKFRNRHIGFIFQEHHLLPQLSVLENVLLPAIAQGGVSAEDESRAQELIERVGLSQRMEHRPAELSGGERQRAAVARALLRRPRLVLGDEPTGSLDPVNARLVGELLLKLQQQEGAMMIVVTHSHELAAMLSRRLRFEEGVLHEEP